MWCKSRHQSAIAAKADVRGWHYSKIEWIPKIWRVATLWMLLGGGFALTTVASAQTPAQVTAARDRVESLDTQPNETYETLMKRAEAMAQAAAQQAFQQPDVNAISVTILGQNQGEIAPILTLAVSRQQWDSQGQAQRWATYFTSARSLLGFDNQSDTAANQFDNADTSTQNVDENVDQTQGSPEATSGDAEAQDPNRQPSTAPTAPDTVPVEVPTPSPDGASAPGTTNPPGSTIINNNAPPNTPPTTPTNVAPVIPGAQPGNDGIIDDNSSPSAPNDEGIIPNDSPVTPNDPEQNLLDSAP